ncbi:chloride transport 6 [Labeo rohita]|uniref:Chloride transport 6 n=1 Tax=Labeo rohita TaxID=84645 RepID=A0A498NZP5_LABRO|nr:chloride transport 6 [Labeo rohita]
MEERFRPLTFHGLILRSQLVNLLIRGVCYAENQSSASQPRLSHSEMTEDYPRFPDIHDLDLALLNPRMIVVKSSDLSDSSGECCDAHSSSSTGAL